MSFNRPVLAATIVVAFAFGLPACSSDDATDAPAASEASSMEATEETSTTTEPTEGSDSSDPTTTEADTDESAPDDAMNPGSETLVDGPAAADKTVAFDGVAFTPSTLEVAPGEVFTFVAGPAASTSAVTFNGNDTYTISGGLTESFTLETTGTYTVTEFISGATMTVTVG